MPPYLSPSSKISRYATLLLKTLAVMPPVAQISATVRPLQRCSGGVAAEPVVEIFRPLEVEGATARVAGTWRARDWKWGC